MSSFLTVLMFSCASDSTTNIEMLIGSNDLSSIKEKRTELSIQQEEIKKNIDRLDSLIARSQLGQGALAVTTWDLVNKNFKHYLDLQGNVMTDENILIYPEMAGALIKVYVKEGESVKKGELLAKIDDGGLESQLAQLTAQASLAKTTYNRQKNLWAKQIGSEIEYLQTKTNYKTTANAVRSARSRLKKSMIYAPFSGVIDNLLQKEGTVVSPVSGTAIFRLINLSDMYIEVDVPENYIGGVIKGREVQVYFPSSGDTIYSTVEQTGNYIKAGNRSFRIQIPVPDTHSNIKPNLTVKVRINDYGNENAMVLPQRVISEDASGEPYVFLADGSNDQNAPKAKKRIIKIGKSQDGFVEVLSGLDIGDQVIDKGATTVSEDQLVEIKTF